MWRKNIHLLNLLETSGKIYLILRHTLKGCLTEDETPLTPWLTGGKIQKKIK